MSPCSSSRRRLPARRCSPSTFCVTTSTRRAPHASNAAIARCAAFGCALSTAARRSAYQRQTGAGSARNPASVASVSGSKRAHRPVSASRKVGIPLSADTPAPVKTTTCAALRNHLRAATTASCASLTTPSFLPSKRRATDEGAAPLPRDAAPPCPVGSPRQRRALAQRLVEHDAGGDRNVQAGHLPAHRNVRERVAALAGEPAHATALGAEHPGDRAGQRLRIDVGRRALVGADDEDVSLADLVECAGE